MTSRTKDRHSSTADSAKSAWDRVRKQLEDERYRITGEIGEYPTPIPACDQDYNHMLAERERVNEELARLDEAEMRSAGGADPRAAIDEFVRSSPYLKNRYLVTIIPSLLQR